MIALSSPAELLAALRTARDVTVLAYTLRPGPLEDAITGAARRGAHVRLRLEGRPFHDAEGTLLEDNRAAVAAVRAAGGDARLVDAADGAAALHAKAALVDGVTYLDDRNFAFDGEETVLRDTFAADAARIADAAADRGDAPSAFFQMRKHDALASEARLLASAQRGDDVVVETESCGAFNRAYAALDGLAKRGAAPRLLVAARDLQNNDRERAALLALQHDGVRVRVIDADEKFALAGRRAWTGSANASAAFSHPDQIDWGVRTDNPAVVTHFRATFEQRWQNAVPLS